jgi:heptosyltransferase-1
MGDIIHTLPALTDAQKAFPAITFDWVVEKNFAEISSWHPAVRRVIEIEFRKWRKSPFKAWRKGDWQQFYRTLTHTTYDRVIDAQGLFKSACMSVLAKGPRYGLDRNSAREPLASLLYQHRESVAKNQHAVERVRQLFAKCLGYDCPTDTPDYGIQQKFAIKKQTPSIIFLPNTTWDTKLWPDSYWQQLAQLLAKDQVTIFISWGNPAEKARAETIAANQPHVEVLPSMSLLELANLISQSKGVVAVDTGLAHLSTALAVPTLTLYGPTNPHLTGTLGSSTQQLSSQFPCAPCLQEKCSYNLYSTITPACFLEITPEIVYNKLLKEPLA